ncbi:SusC/RagA family TonB-linked outer membrane protein [Maribacter ulvicola]|uniref:TonB-linked outer membrane protein, SusC/RagA family n=1 Tax=Maribacter ulvicola TaxID=228959 RepID=A0A1N6S584_9FLAO|nr:TonB-dependent receptor [Maribacter ulvicola]SIQ36200.1 TonB-linked outer membrane protein, SusC/RagA family [Maribacter ulvicola]
MKKNYLLLIFFVCSSFIWAQQRTVTGEVTDAQGLPLAGANIIEQNTTNGVQSDFDGKFAIKTSVGQVLVVSYIGFKSQNITVGTSNTINVTLIEDAASLEEVIVVGYGTQQKTSLTGSVATIDANELEKQPVLQASQALQGLSPGLTAIQSSGQPGSDGASLRVRGVNSINNSSSPTIIIDGIEGSLDGLEMSDISNISVLKDAGAAAIYGNRGANGVILITTKRAKLGKASISYNSYVGFQKPTNQPKPVDALTYLEITEDDALLQEYLANPNDKDNYPDTDWIDLLFSESGFMQSHNVTVSGGSEAVRTRASFSYQEQEGNIPNFGTERFQGRINTDFKVSDKLKIGTDLNFRRTETTSARGGNGVNGAYRQPAIFPAIYSDGTFALPSTGGNPISDVRQTGQNVGQGNYLRALLKATYSPIPELTISATYSPEHAESYSTNYSPQYEVVEFFGSDPILRSSGTNNEIQLTNGNSRSFTDNFFATAQFSKNFKKHYVSVLAGYEFLKNKNTSFNATRYGFAISGLEVLNAGSEENDSNSGSADQYGLESVFGRFNYAYDNKYLLEFVLRRDASSRFSPENRTGNFPSISAGWRITEENFMQGDDFFDNLKLFGSWGQLGNQVLLDGNGNLINFPYSALISLGNGHYLNEGVVQTAAQSVLSNPGISWETAEKTNIGLDFSILNNRLSGTVEYYNNETNDLLGTQQIPSTTGLGSPQANIFSLKNSGVDLDLQWEDTIGEHFNYFVGGNFATVKNEVTNLNGVDFIINGSSITQVGEPLGSIYGYETVSIFQTQEEIDAAPAQFGTLEPGDLQYRDINGRDANGELTGEPDGIINSDDRKIIGNSFPSKTFAFNFGFNYKTIDFSVNAIGVTDREVFLTRNLVQPLFNAGNIFEYHLTQSWTPENPNARFPILKNYSGASNNSVTNSTYVFDASYLRIRNITLGYTVPKVALEKVDFLSKVRIYATGQNLLTFNNDLPDGIDVLIPNGSQGNVYPLTTSYTFGINVTF